MSQEQDPAVTVPDPKAALFEILKGKPDAPDMGQIDKWKQTFGDVFMSGFSEEEIFIFRPLNRGEYTDMQVKQQMAQMKAAKRNESLKTNEATLTPEQWADVEKAVKEEAAITETSDETLVLKCLLWPKMTVDDLSKKAGTIPALVEQIMANSNFVTPQVAAQLVFKL